MSVANHDPFGNFLRDIFGRPGRHHSHLDRTINRERCCDNCRRIRVSFLDGLFRFVRFSDDRATIGQQLTNLQDREGTVCPKGGANNGDVDVRFQG